MKIRLERDVLAEAVAWAARSLPVRPSVPILAGLLVRADADRVTFSSFDYETSAQIEVRATVADEGEALVSGRLLADISKSLPAKPVDISSDDTRMELVCGSARFTLQTLPVWDYPSLPKMPGSTGSVPSAVFAQAVSQVVVAAGRDELLPVFTGVRVEIEGETISLLATDRYRMALKELSWRPGSTQISATALVPAKVLNDTSRSMTAGEDVTLSLAAAAAGDGIIGFEGHGAAGERQTTTRLLDGEFPKVRHIMNIAAAVERAGQHRGDDRGGQAGGPGCGTQHLAADADRRRFDHAGGGDRGPGPGLGGDRGQRRPARGRGPSRDRRRFQPRLPAGRPRGLRHPVRELRLHRTQQALSAHRPGGARRRGEDRLPARHHADAAARLTLPGRLPGLVGSLPDPSLGRFPTLT